MSRRKFLRNALIMTAGLGTTGLLTYTYASAIEPYALSVSQVKVPIPNLPDAFEGYRITQISDIHYGTWMNEERLSRVVAEVNAQQSDVIVITGDYVTRGDPRDIMEELVRPLSNFKAPDGVLSVLGNHDHWVRAFVLRDIMNYSGIHELRNRSIVFERDNAKLAIAGVDDVWERKADLNQVLKTLPEPDVPAILLAHEPDYADLSAESGRFALQLSGHSHGGQVRLPFIGAPILPKLGKKYSIGMYQVRNMLQYTNRGVGMTPPTVRLGCPPEISVFTLTQQPV